MTVGVAQPAAARNRAQVARRERILTSAQRLLCEREYEEIQIREVAEEAGVALGTLYRYFPSKELLYAHALSAWSGSFAVRVQARDRPDDTDADRLRAALRRAAQAYERSPQFFRLLTVLEVTTDPAVRLVFSAFSDRFLSLLRRVLRETHERDAAAVAFVAGAVLGSGLRGWSQQGMPMRSVYERLDATVDLIFGQPERRPEGAVVGDRHR